ncbi:MAG: hypothetical protein IJV43_09170 [Oscillospiraceae bacterium]|nr:hypothetical protein [Oscillospiraceae bacterium]
MELYQEILSNMIRNHQEEPFFPLMAARAAWIVGTESYRALQKIKAVLDDDALGDEACFKKIEEIVCIFEKMGSRSSRHDFG